MLKPPYTYALKGHKQLRVYQPTVPLYNIPYYIYIGNTVNDAALYLEADHPGVLELIDITPNTGASAIHLIHPEIGSSYCMLLGIDQFQGHNALNPYGVLSHESLHLSWFIGERIGIIYELDNHEPQAYLMQNIVETSIEAIKDYCKRYRINANL